MTIQAKNTDLETVQTAARNLDRFVEKTGKSEKEYAEWATQVGRRMHVNKLDRILCEKHNIYTVAHLIMLPVANFDEKDMRTPSEIVDETENAYELAKMWLDTKKDVESYYSKETIMNEHLHGIRKSCFERWGDVNCIKDVSKKWFNEDAIQIDVKAEALSEAHGIEITEDDIVEFVKANKPYGYQNPMKALLNRIEDKFKSVHGFALKDYYAKHLVSSCEYVANEIIDFPF